MATVITYSDVADAATGLQYDRPSVELMRTKYPSAITVDTSQDAAVALGASLAQVDNFITSFAVGSTIICVGGEQVNGISEVLVNNNFIDATPPSQTKDGFIKSFQYKGQNIFVLTGGVSPTELLDSRQGTINAAYFLFKNNLQPGVGNNLLVNLGTTELVLATYDLTGGDIAKAVADCESGLTKFIIQSLGTESGVDASSYDIVDCYVENNKLNVLVVNFGTLPLIPILWTLGVTIVSAAAAWITTKWSAVEQAKQNTQQAAFSALQAAYYADKPNCPDYWNQYANITISKAKYDALKSEFESKGGTIGQISDLLKTALVVGVVGIGVTFLFKSGLFTAGVESTRRRLQKKKSTSSKKK